MMRLIDCIEVGVSVYCIVKYQLMIKRSTTYHQELLLSLNKVFKAFYYSIKMNCIMKMGMACENQLQKVVDRLLSSLFISYEYITELQSQIVYNSKFVQPCVCVLTFGASSQL